MCYLREGTVGLRRGDEDAASMTARNNPAAKPFIFRKEVWFFNLKLTDCLNKVTDLIS